MAMYVFQELAPKVFYFTYCLQEIGNYVGFIEDSENGSVNNNLISKWENKEYGSIKTFSSDFTNESERVDVRSTFLINNLKATMHYCFTQYRLFNNIEDQVNLNKSFSVVKYFEGNKEKEEPFGKYTAKLYINSSYEGGEFLIPGRQPLKPEAGSLIIYPSNLNVDSTEVKGNSKYVGVGHWV
jgi:hypothetical protein